MSNAAVYNAADFSDVMIAAVREWQAATAGDKNVARNMPDLVQYYPQGLSSFFAGTPVVG